MHRVFWPAAAPLLLASCLMMEQPPPETENRNVSPWYDLPAVTMTHADLARKVREAIFRQDHEVRDLADTPWKISSEWKLMLRQYQGEGARSRLEAEILRDGPGRFIVRVRSWRDYNTNVISPMSPDHAVWEKGGLSPLHVDNINPPGERLFHSLKVSLLAYARD